MLSRDSDFDFDSIFVFELVIWPEEVTLIRWTQPSGPLYLWQCLEKRDSDPWQQKRRHSWRRRWGVEVEDGTRTWGESSLLKGNIDQDQNQATKRINELAEKLAGDTAIKDLTARFKDVPSLSCSISFQDAEGEWDVFPEPDVTTPIHLLSCIHDRGDELKSWRRSSILQLYQLFATEMNWPVSTTRSMTGWSVGNWSEWY